MRKKLFTIFINSFAVFFLAALVIAPFYFANNFSQVAGVKTQSKYLLISQVDKFPQMKFTQEDKLYQLTFKKQGNSQAYLGVFIINNPTPSTQSYTIDVNTGQTSVFFGQDSNNLETTITLPSSASVPISILSTNSIVADQVVEFSIN